MIPRSKGNGPISPLGRRKRALQGWLYYLAFCGLALSAIASGLVMIDKPVLGLAAYCLLLIFATIAWTRAEDRAGLTLHDVRQRDKRDPVLYLRPFEEDYVEIIESVDPGLSPSGQREVGMDEVLRPLNAIGPLVSIRRPGLGLRVGYTEQPGDDEWQSRVLDLLGEAGLVVLVLGGSPGIEWEIEQICESTPLGSLLIFSPPGRHSSFLTGVRRAEKEKVNYEEFAQLFEKHFHVKLPPFSNSIYFIGFDDEKQLVLPGSVTARDNWEDNYRQEWSTVDQQLREVLAQVRPNVNLAIYREYGHASRLARKILAMLLYTMSLPVAIVLVVLIWNRLFG